METTTKDIIHSELDEYLDEYKNSFSVRTYLCLMWNCFFPPNVTAVQINSQLNLHFFRQLFARQNKVWVHFNLKCCENKLFYLRSRNAAFYFKNFLVKKWLN